MGEGVKRQIQIPHPPHAKSNAHSYSFIGCLKKVHGIGENQIVQKVVINEQSLISCMLVYIV